MRRAGVVAAAAGIRGLALGICLLLFPLAALAEEPNISPQALERLKSRISEISAWLEEAEEDRSELVNVLREVEQEIGAINGRLHELRRQQAELEQELAALEDEAQVLKERLNRQRGALKAQLRSAWMQGEASVLKVLLNETDPQQVARLMTYHEYLSQDAMARLEQFNQTLAALRENRDQALSSRARLEAARADTLAELEQRETLQADREKTLAALKKDISSRQTELERLQADRERLAGLLEQVEEAVRNIPLPEESTPFKNLRAKLPWPTRGKVVATYGEPMAGGKLHRNGIVIASPAGQAVRAIHYGRVVFANWLKGFGLLLIIDHGDGYMSLYGQNGSLLKSVGDWVTAGETVALTGHGASSNPDGLYFEIRHQGEPSDPSRWLGEPLREQ